MNNFIYNIKGNNGKYGFCYFCNIKIKNKNFHVMITSYEILDENYIANNKTVEISINNKIELIEFGNIKIITKEYGFSVIEIKDNKTNKINFFELDDYLEEKEPVLYYNKKLIYIIDCEKESDISVSYNIINTINESQLIFSYDINAISYISPIFNLNNNKLIGLYNSDSKNYKKGIFFKYVINEFIKRMKYKHNLYNEVDISISITKEDINNKIYFLDNYEDSKHYHDNLTELNESNTEVFINKHKMEYKKYFIAQMKGEHKIKLKFFMNLKNSSYMFAGCSNITNINFISFNTEYIEDMKYMFFNCENLKSINNLFYFDTKNVIDMSYMFYKCKILNNLDLFSFNVENVIDMSYMFYCCNGLNNLDLSSFNFENVIDMSYMFYCCNSLNNLYIPFFNTKNVMDVSYMFYGCENLKNLDLTFFDTTNVINIESIFYKCEKALKSNSSTFKKFDREIMTKV